MFSRVMHVAQFDTHVTGENTDSAVDRAGNYMQHKASLQATVPIHVLYIFNSNILLQDIIASIFDDLHLASIIAIFIDTYASTQHVRCRILRERYVVMKMTLAMAGPLVNHL